MSTPLINILIRTSHRPAQFAKCLQSIYNQDYKNIRIIVSYDTAVRPEYIPKDIEAVPVSYPPTEPAYYNFYCNDLKELVTDGYFFFLDDDDTINSDCRTLSRIVKQLHPNCLLIVQYSRNGKKKPVVSRIIPGKIGMPCIVVHHTHKSKVTFEGSMCADYKYIKAMTDLMPWKFMPVVLVEASVRGMGVGEINNSVDNIINQ